MISYKQLVDQLVESGYRHPLSWRATSRIAEDFMDTVRISELLSPFLKSSLSETQLNQISIYIDLLKRWNARINLTAIRDDEEIVTRHFGESLFMARHLFPNDAESDPERSRAASGPIQQVLDIGSGAGFPALPLKVWAPDIDLTLIESNHKKAAFLNEVARALTLMNINVITERAQVVAAKHPNQSDLVTLRAVERFDNILPLAASLLTPRGTLALLIGADQIPKLSAVKDVDWRQPIHIPESHSRVLSIGVRS